ncbi:hypothetical protein Awo_c27580 [Acetobacterium woodii DSM 1030]|uniref:Uncharacterized protein n=1 Tax=Acetobacterium woodii (strain ATCC 29683 / DSM 1030 / JCM 2381 / KCTC 1655 / WB1) TaxID=931626 RepID=H6LG33_ACEWD|nr:hypothetical protein Awo_c27580 [Acetobacterium woodii DSM 1030]
MFFNFAITYSFLWSYCSIFYAKKDLPKKYLNFFRRLCHKIFIKPFNYFNGIVLFI